MSSVAAVLGNTYINHPLKTNFLKWQCHVRQLMMRQDMGRPGDAIIPEVILNDETEPMGHVITILNKAPAYSLVPEMLHLARKTKDPAHHRSQALNFFSATYYQKYKEFSDLLTATFPPGSPGAAKIREAEYCTLRFEAFSQEFNLHCRVWALAPHNPMHEATMAHNRLFNPALPSDIVVLGFEPDWDKSTSNQG